MIVLSMTVNCSTADVRIGVLMRPENVDGVKPVWVRVLLHPPIILVDSRSVAHA